MKKLLLTLCLSTFIYMAFAQRSTLDIVGIHQEVDESISEHNLQVTARDKQAGVTATEQGNTTLLGKLKATYRTLQQRYNTLGTAIAVADVGIYAAPMVDQIVSYQSQIVSLAEKNPALIAIGFQAELQFAGEAKSLLGYVAGLLLSYGDINQMKASDRKMLFDYVVSQLSNLQQLSGNMVNMMQYSSLTALLRAANPFQNFISSDKSIGNSIIQNAKYLK